MSYAATELNSLYKASAKNSSFWSKKGSNGVVKNLLKFSPLAVLVLIIVVVAVALFAPMIVLPSLFHDKSAEAFDIQHSNNVLDLETIYQQMLMQNELDKTSIERLKEKGVLVGYLDNDGKFVESNDHSGGLVLKFQDKIITPSEFPEAMNDVRLFDAVTYSSPAFSRAAGYHDEVAQTIFRKVIGTNRNNYTAESDFNEVMSEKIGKGSDINVNSVSYVKKTRKNERGEEEVYYELAESGNSATSKDDAGEFIRGVVDKNPARNSTEAALYSAYDLTVADTISREKRSVSLYTTLMESGSMLKAEEGNDAKIPEMMDYLTEVVEDTVLDVDTREEITVIGSAMESPSLYAVMTDSPINPDEVKNYSTERILKTVQNQLETTDANAAISETVVSSTKKKGSIGRFISSGIEKASTALLELVKPTVSSSLVDNSFSTIKGIKAGEMLVEGAINTGALLAKGSGATLGDAEAVVQTVMMNDKIVALEAARDRLNRSPFDITSKNTFIGSIVYNLAVSATRVKSWSVISGFSTVMKSVGKAVSGLMPKTYADEVSSYLTVHGDCERFERIGGVGTAGCSENATFDTSTAVNPFNDSGFIDFVNKNTTLNSAGARVINRGSDLEKFIIYGGYGRETPVGTMDGGILNSLASGSSSISFSSNILSMIKSFLGASEADKRIASGATFVNSSSNPDWQTYKYAQRYVSLARATAMLRQFSDDENAYQNIKFFEGGENPVIALLRDYYAGR